MDRNWSGAEREVRLAIDHIQAASELLRAEQRTTDEVGIRRDELLKLRVQVYQQGQSKAQEIIGRRLEELGSPQPEQPTAGDVPDGEAELRLLVERAVDAVMDGGTIDFSWLLQTISKRLGQLR